MDPPIGFANGARWRETKTRRPPPWKSALGISDGAGLRDLLVARLSQASYPDAVAMVAINAMKTQDDPYYLRQGKNPNRAPRPAPEKHLPRKQAGYHLPNLQNWWSIESGMKNITILSVGAAIALVASTAPAMASGSSGANNANFENTSWRVTRVAEDVAFDQLPAAVQSTIRAQAPDEQIDKIKLETKKGETCYRVKFARAPGRHLHPELLVASDGSILKEKHMANVSNEPAGAGLQK